MCVCVWCMLCDQLMMIQYLALVLWGREGWGGVAGIVCLYIAAEQSSAAGGEVGGWWGTGNSGVGPENTRSK